MILNIYNYIEYMREHDERLYQKYIYPALYQKPYEPEEEVQLDITDIDDSRANDLDIRFSEYQELVDDDMEKLGEVSDTTREIIRDAGLYIEDTDMGPVVTGNRITKANELARQKGRFNSGNEYRFTKPDKTFNDENQIEMEL